MVRIHGLNYTPVDEIAETKVSDYFKIHHHMSATKFLRGECQHCGGHLEFPAEAAGTSAECPHCQQSTELFISTGESDDTADKAKTKTIIFIALASLILLGGLAGAMIALKRAKRIAASQTTQRPTATTNAVANPFAAQKFSASDVKLEASPGSSLVRAVGTIKNLSPHRRFGVRIEIELADDSGKPLTPATDYAATIEPGAAWNFKAMVNARGAASAKVVAIKEEN
jgi:flagellar basal body-associated protein FliL